MECAYIRLAWHVIQEEFCREYGMVSTQNNAHPNILKICSLYVVITFKLNVLIHCFTFYGKSIKSLYLSMNRSGV